MSFSHTIKGGYQFSEDIFSRKEREISARKMVSTICYLHGVAALARWDLLPAGVQHRLAPPPGHRGARPAWGKHNCRVISVYQSIVSLSTSVISTTCPILDILAICDTNTFNLDHSSFLIFSPLLYYLCIISNYWSVSPSLTFLMFLIFLIISSKDW